MLRPTFARSLTRQLLGNSRYFRPIRITSSPSVFFRTSLGRSLDFSKNSSASRSYCATELDVADFRSKNGYLHNLLGTRMMSPNCYWGFVIIRTTYTPESDLQWPVAMAKLSDWLRVEMRSGSNASDNEQELVVTKFRNLVADDKKLYDGLPMSDAVLRFEDILDEQYNVALNYSTPEHFDKTWYYRIPEFVEQSLVESDPDIKRDLLEASYWHLNNYICLVIDEESLKDLVELPAELHNFDLASALKEIREHPHGPPPARRTAHLKVAIRHSDFDMKDCEEWYTQWAKWAVCRGLGLMHWSIRSCEMNAGMVLNLQDGEPYVEIYGQD